MLAFLKGLTGAWMGKQKRASRLLFMGLMLVITMGLLSWLIYRQKDVLLSYQWVFRPWPIVLSFVFYILSLLLTSMVWYRVISALGNRLSFAKNFRYFCIANLGKRLPGTVWYIPWRAKMYQEQGLSLRAVSIASGIELLVSFISGAVISLIFMAPALGKLGLNAPVMLALLALALGLLHPAVITKISAWLHVNTAQVQYRQILQWIALYAAFWLTGGCLLFFIVNIFTPLGVTHLPYVIGTWSLTGILSMSVLLLPSNLGLTEISISLLLSLVIPSPVAVVTAIGSRVLILFYEIIWAGIAIWQEGSGHLRLIKDPNRPNNP